MIEVEFQLQRADFAAARVAEISRHRLAALLIVAVMGSLPVLVGALMSGRGSRFLGVLVMVPVVMILIHSEAFWRWQLRNTPPGAPIRFAAEDSGITYRNSAGSAQIRWEGIKAFKESRTGFYLWMRGGFNVLTPIPKRVMTSEQLQAFRSLLNSRLLPT